MDNTENEKKNGWQMEWHQRRPCIRTETGTLYGFEDHTGIKMLVDAHNKLVDHDYIQKLNDAHKEQVDGLVRTQSIYLKERTEFVSRLTAANGKVAELQTQIDGLQWSIQSSQNRQLPDDDYEDEETPSKGWSGTFQDLARGTAWVLGIITLMAAVNFREVLPAIKTFVTPYNCITTK